MKLLLLNGNTNATITDRLAAAARAIGGHQVVGATARFGARYISTRAASVVAAHAVLDALATHLPGGGFDAAIIACFGDPGLEAAREAFALPVLGLADSSLRQGFGHGRVVSLLTGGAAWVPMLEEFARPRTPPGGQVRVRAIPPTGDMIAREPERALAMLAKAVRAEAAAGAACVVLGGAGLVGLAPRLRPLAPVPVLDCLEATLADLPHVAAAPVPMQPAPSTGLSTPLAALLAQA